MCAMKFIYYIRSNPTSTSLIYFSLIVCISVMLIEQNTIQPKPFVIYNLILFLLRGLLYLQESFSDENMSHIPTIIFSLLQLFVVRSNEIYKYPRNNLHITTLTKKNIVFTCSFWCDLTIEHFSRVPLFRWNGLENLFFILVKL